MSLPPTEPIKETLKNIKINIPFMEDKELLANSKYLLVHWRRWNTRSNFLQLYLYKDEMISRLPNFSFIKKILFKRRFNQSINETKKFFQKRKLKEADKKSKRYRIWAWLGAIYGPIIFWVLFVNLPKIEWKYVFESNKNRVARHHEKAKEIGLPGIPYWRNTGTAAVLYVNEEGIAYAMCGPDFFCSEKLNAKKGIHYLPVAGEAKRIKSNIIFALNSYWCDSYDINNSGKCRSGGWVNGSER